MKNIYEIFDSFEEAKSKEEKMKVIGANLSPTLVAVLEMTFHPKYEWHYKEMPHNFKPLQTVPGVSYAKLHTHLRKMYLFQKGHPESDKLTDQRRKQLLLQFLEALEPREAEIIIGIFKKDQGVKGLTYKFVKDAFADLLPECTTEKK